MRRYWGHAAMLLLGVSLTVGFYEGRALVQNTAKALSAATTITAPTHPKRERRRDAERDVARSVDEPDREPGSPKGERKRKNRRMAPVALPQADQPMLVPGGALSRNQVDLSRQQRVRPRAFPTPVRPVQLEEPEELLDTGLLDPAPD
jgi:hypothetical protein